MQTYYLLAQEVKFQIVFESYDGFGASDELLDYSRVLVDLQQVSLAAKTGEGKKARETCNTWQPWSLAGQDSVQSASFYKKLISNHMLRKDNETTERGSTTFYDNGRLKFR